MKKTLLLISFIAILAGFSGCGKEEYNTMETAYVTVYDTDWKQFSKWDPNLGWDEDYDFYELSISQLSPSVLQYGQINVSIQEGPSSRPTLYPLPYVKSYIEVTNEGGEFSFTETFRYRLVSPNRIRFERETSDLIYNISPGTRTFKITIIHP